MHSGLHAVHFSQQMASPCQKEIGMTSLMDGTGQSDSNQKAEMLKFD